jgi:cellobiose dehydrogenase (acceptor)
VPADKTNYLSKHLLPFNDALLTGTAKRIGPLAQAAPDIGPMMWEEVEGPDGIVRQMQWTSRVESSNNVTAPDDNGMLSVRFRG